MNTNAPYMHSSGPRAPPITTLTSPCSALQRSKPPRPTPWTITACNPCAGDAQPFAGGAVMHVLESAGHSGICANSSRPPPEPAAGRRGHCVYGELLTQVAGRTAQRAHTCSQTWARTWRDTLPSTTQKAQHAQQGHAAWGAPAGCQSTSAPGRAGSGPPPLARGPTQPLPPPIAGFAGLPRTRHTVTESWSRPAPGRWVFCHSHAGARCGAAAIGTCHVLVWRSLWFHRLLCDGDMDLAAQRAMLRVAHDTCAIHQSAWGRRMAEEPPRTRRVAHARGGRMRA